MRILKYKGKLVEEIGYKVGADIYYDDKARELG